MRAGFCAIIGRPNVGKSTFLNRVLGQKLAAVTPKPQTTRNRIIGVKNLAEAQIVFVDTPGVHKGSSELNRYMVEQALAAAGEADVVLYLIEAGAAEIGVESRMIIDSLAKLKAPIILGLNKVDVFADKSRLLPILESWKAVLPFQDIVPISAARGTQVDTLVDLIAAALPEGERLYPEEMLTDRAERFFAAEAVREQLFLKLREEVPYGTAVTIERFEERRAGDALIEAVIHVERDSQKGIVVGQGGRMIKEIGTRARESIAGMLGCPVHLKLFVKVDPDWSSSPAALKRFGYE